MHILAHQWVCITVALCRLFPDSLSRSRVTVETDILRAELKERGPFSWSRGGWPRVGVNHPGSRVLPRCPATVQLQRDTECNNETCEKALGGILFLPLIFVLSGVIRWNVLKFQTSAFKSSTQRRVSLLEFNKTLHGGTHFAAISAWLHVVSLLCCRETNLSRPCRSSSPSLPLRGYILVISCCLIKSEANYTQIESTNWIHFTLTNISLVLWEGKSERFYNYTHYISWRRIPQTSPQNFEPSRVINTFYCCS